MVENDKRCHQIILQKMCIEFVDRWVRRQHDSFFQEGSALQNQKKLHPLIKIMMTVLVFRSIDSNEKHGEEIDIENCKNCKNSGQNFYKC